MVDQPDPWIFAAAAALFSVWLAVRLRTLWRRRRQVQPMSARVLSFDDRDDAHNPAEVAYEVNGQRFESTVKIPRQTREITILIDPDDPARTHAKGQPPTVVGTMVLALAVAAGWVLAWYTRRRAQGLSIGWLDDLMVGVPIVWTGLGLLVVLIGMVGLGGVIAFRAARRLAAGESPVMQGGLVAAALALIALGLYPFAEAFGARSLGDGPGAALGGVLLLGVGAFLCGGARRIVRERTQPMAVAIALAVFGVLAIGLGVAAAWFGVLSLR
ncbi:MAG TPA: hypothetical protein GXZ30_06120 [Propionibacterium sp.]|jgi:hypothetical protein|nr:hypothetical protein [Propionibacterium sp.]